jgi:predicted metal-dependent phosphoesterase TrpH
MTRYPEHIDLHMHTTVSDGTDTPEEILQNVKKAGIELFSVTDHDAIKGCQIIQAVRKEDDPVLIPGAEFSCRDEEGKYHILGYAYDPEAEGVNSLVETGHRYRMNKVRARLDFIAKKFGFEFSEADLAKLLSMDNPGKPHIGNLMVRYGYAKSKEDAIRNYIDKIRFKTEYVRPDQAIRCILESGGIPVLAHPSYGSGDDLIIGKDMELRIRRLMDFGLQGLEAYYSGFTVKLRNEILSFADKYDLLVTAGSDYHGTNKMIDLGDTGLPASAEYPEALRRFLDAVHN